MRARADLSCDARAGEYLSRGNEKPKNTRGDGGVAAAIAADCHERLRGARTRHLRTDVQGPASCFQAQRRTQGASAEGAPPSVISLTHPLPVLRGKGISLRSRSCYAVCGTTIE